MIEQNPAAKRTMMMKPKPKNNQGGSSKTDLIFRLNSSKVTTRRMIRNANNIISLANDDSRLTNFIQSDNYEIISYRSNNND